MAVLRSAPQSGSSSSRRSAVEPLDRGARGALPARRRAARTGRRARRSPGRAARSGRAPPGGPRPRAAGRPTVCRRASRRRCGSRRGSRGSRTGARRRRCRCPRRSPRPRCRAARARRPRRRAAGRLRRCRARPRRRTGAPSTACLSPVYQTGSGPSTRRRRSRRRCRPGARRATNASPSSSLSISRAPAATTRRKGEPGRARPGSAATWSRSCFHSGPTSSMSAGSSLSMTMSSCMRVSGRGLGSLSQPAGTAQRLCAARLSVRGSSTASRSATAPALLSGSLRLPHLGLCTQEGQPLSQGHSATSARASAARLSKAS